MKAIITAKIKNSDNQNYIAELSTSNQFSSVISSSPEPADEFNLVKFSVENLSPNTKYYVRITNSNDIAIDNYVGSFRTTSAGAHNFKFGFASCSWSNSEAASNQEIYDNIANKALNNELDFFFHLGDMHYRDITVNNESLFQKAYDDVFSASRQNNCWKNLPMYYMWDDHDYGPNDADKNSPSRNAATAAFRRRVPSPSLANSSVNGAAYYSFIRGRVRFIVTDLRSEREPKGLFSTNDSRQKPFSDTQKNWFFNQMLLAKNSGQAIVWINTKPWISSTADENVNPPQIKDDWGGYHAARLEIANFIQDNGLRDSLVVLSGDMHALAYDDGTSVNNYGNLRVCHAAPLDEQSRAKGGLYLLGPITADSGSGYSTQYGIIEVTDSGTTNINIRFKGIVISKIDFSESTPIDVNFNLNVPLVSLSSSSSSSSSSSLVVSSSSSSSLVVSSSSSSSNNYPQCATAPNYIDTNNPCYQNVISNDTYCCDVAWDGSCDSAYIACTETFLTSSLWIDPALENIIFQPLPSSSSSSNGSPSEALSYNNMCLSKVAAGNQWSFMVNTSGFVTGWGNSTALGLLPITRQSFFNVSEPFFTDIAIGGGNNIGGVGFNIVCRRNGTISTWGETFRGNYIRELELSDNFGFTEVGATLNTAIAKRGQDIRFLGDVNYADTAYFTGENENFLSFSCGYFHILLETLSGTLLGYKDYNYFQAGTVPENLGAVNLYAAGYGYSLAVQKNGTITGWGVNGVVGDEVGFPPDWTVDTIRRSYGSGQLNIPTTVRRFASGTAWTGVDSHFEWPSGKIVKLLGGNGYAGAIVSEYDVDSEGEPVNPLINNLYIWGNNPYFSGVPSVIPDIIDGSIGRRSMLLINTGNNLVYYGFNSGWISDSFADLNDPKSIANADYDFNNISGNLGGLCSKTFIEDIVVAASNDFRVTGNYLFDLNLRNVFDEIDSNKDSSLRGGDRPINDPESYFALSSQAQDNRYPIAAGLTYSGDIVGDHTVFEIKKAGEILPFNKEAGSPTREWQAGGELYTDELSVFFSYTGFNMGMTNLIFINDTDLNWRYAGNPIPTINEDPSYRVVEGLDDFSKISTVAISSRTLSLKYFSSLAWDCRFFDGWFNRICENEPYATAYGNPFERVKNSCLETPYINEHYQSYAAQLLPGGSDISYIRSATDVKAFLTGFYSSETDASNLSLTFTKNSIESGFASTNENARNFNSGNFTSTLAYLFMTQNRSEFLWNEVSDQNYRLIKQYFTLNSEDLLTLTVTKRSAVPMASKRNKIESATISKNGSEPFPVNLNFGPRLSNVYSSQFLDFNVNDSPYRSSHFVTSRPDLLVYSRNNLGSLSGSSLNDLRPMPCSLEISPYYPTSRPLEGDEDQDGRLQNIYTQTYPFVDQVTNFTDFIEGVAPVFFKGIVKEPNPLASATFVLPGSRSPVLKSMYLVSGSYIETLEPPCRQALGEESNNDGYIENTGLRFTTFRTRSLAGVGVYWPNEYISEFSNGEISKRPDAVTQSLSNTVYNNTIRKVKGFGENVYIFTTKPNVRTFFDILRRIDQGDFMNQSQSNLVRWGIVGVRPEKTPFSYLTLPLSDRNFPIGINLNLNKILYQVVDKAIISPNFPSPSSNPDNKRPKFFIKEGCEFKKENLHPRLLYPIAIGPFASTSVLLSGYLNSGAEFNNNYILGLQLLNSSEQPVGKEIIIKNNDNIGWHTNFVEVPQGYVRSNLSNDIIIKSGIRYGSFVNSENEEFKLPLFQGIEKNFSKKYLNDNQVFYNFNQPISVPLNHSIALQIYSQNMGEQEESILYEANTNNTNYGYALPKRYVSSNNIDYEYRFTPINFKILNGNLPYLLNPELENLRVKQLVVTCPIHDTINITEEI